MAKKPKTKLSYRRLSQSNNVIILTNKKLDVPFTIKFYIFWSIKELWLIGSLFLTSGHMYGNFSSSRCQLQVRLLYVILFNKINKKFCFNKTQQKQKCATNFIILHIFIAVATAIFLANIRHYIEAIPIPITCGCQADNLLIQQDSSGNRS